MSRVPPYLRSHPKCHHGRRRGYHPLWPPVPGAFSSRWHWSLCGWSHAHPGGLATPTAQRREAWHAAGLGCSPVARRYWGNGVCSSGYVRCFSSPGALVTAYVFSGASPPIKAEGLPHSEMAGSQPDSGSPARFGGSPRPSSVFHAEASIAGGVSDCRSSPLGSAYELG